MPVVDREGREVARHCAQCDRDVHEVARLTRREAEILARRRTHDARVCLRVHVRKRDGAVLLADGHATMSGSGEPDAPALFRDRVSTMAVGLAFGLAACSPAPPREPAVPVLAAPAETVVPTLASPVVKHSAELIRPRDITPSTEEPAATGEPLVHDTPLEPRYPQAAPSATPKPVAAPPKLPTSAKKDAKSSSKKGANPVNLDDYTATGGY